METVNLKLENFEGPLSLLYHLIEKNKVDIYDIPIAEITEQYMEYIYNAKNMDMEIMSSFIVMAATLMEIKSKMLLPKTAKETMDEPDPREELVNRLIEYKKYIKIGEMLKQKESLYSQRIFKEPDAAINKIRNEYDNIDSFMRGVTFNDLFNAFKVVLEKRDNKIDNVRSNFRTVEHDEFTVYEKMEYIKDILYITPKIKFSDIFLNDSTKIEIVITFLALLELIKTGTIIIIQEFNFGDIIITKNREVQL